MQELKLLGFKATDIVTGFSGIVTSVTFDLYGCVQALIHPGLDKDGKLVDQCWFDVKRLRIDGAAPIMPAPTFAIVPGGQSRPAFKQKPMP